MTLGRSLVSHALVVLAGLQLVLWVFVRRDGLTKALLPTDAPFWLDRGVTAAAAVVGAAGIIAGVLGMLRLPAAEACRSRGREVHGLRRSSERRGRYRECRE